nr:hypothetical protein [Tanacetum cinerariifolium]
MLSIHGCVLLFSVLDSVLLRMFLIAFWSTTLGCVLIDTMADVNFNAPTDQAPTMAPPTHTDDQILPHIRWVTQTSVTALRGLQLSAEDQKSLSEKKKKEEHLRLLLHL